MFDFIPDWAGPVVGVVGAGAGVVMKAKAANLLTEVQEAIAAAKAADQEIRNAYHDKKLTDAELVRISAKLQTAIAEIEDVASIGLKLWSIARRKKRLEVTGGLGSAQ